MTEPNPVGDPETKQDPVGGDPPVAPFRAFATEADFKSFEAKRAEKHEREMKALRMEIDTLKQSTLTEEQKAAEARKVEQETFRRQTLEEADRRAGFLGVALSNGLTKDQADKWYGLAGPEFSDPQEAFVSVQKSLGVDLKTKPVAGGGGRNPNGEDAIEYTPEYVSEQMAKYGGSAWYAANRSKIDAWRAKRFPNTGPRPLTSLKG